MSHVLTAILVLDGDAHAFDGPKQDARIAEIDAWILANSTYPNAKPMKRIDGAFGGSSAPQVELFAFASARVDQVEFVEYLRSLTWVAAVPGRSMGDIVQLLVNCEHDAGMKVVPIFGEAEVECCHVPPLTRA